MSEQFTAMNKALASFLVGEGYDAYQYLGSHAVTKGGVAGVQFCVWAPNAVAVYVAGDFNNWVVPLQEKALEMAGGFQANDVPGGKEPDVLPKAVLEKTAGVPIIMQKKGEFWVAFAPAVQGGARYKYVVQDSEGTLHWKADPFAFSAEYLPQNASRVCSKSTYKWRDDAWQKRLTGNSYEQPMNIYELHLGSWQRGEDGRYLNYVEIGERLVKYAVEMQYTHVELMPLTEYPYDPSWGYQVTGYFAPTARYGTPEEFQQMVDILHRAGIGVILDWVPAHFPKDGYGLYFFDGTPCYEDSNPLHQEHQEWGTMVFDFAKPQVQSFLISSALYWLLEYHIDGLRVDAVYSMLYLDYGRAPGKWTPNEHGGRENLGAVQFLQRLNEQVAIHKKNAMMIAEEATAWPGVTASVSKGGLGFTYKWNMGWTSDMLSYLQAPPERRSALYEKMIFSFVYAFSEYYILPFSHDNAARQNEKAIQKTNAKTAQSSVSNGSLWGRMAEENDNEKFALARTFLAYMAAHPGKKMLFMGTEFLQKTAWSALQELPWEQAEGQVKFLAYVKKLNGFYRAEPALWQVEKSWDGLQVLVGDDSRNNIIVLLRTDKKGNSLVCLFHFGNTVVKNYEIGVPMAGRYEVVFSTNEAEHKKQSGGEHVYQAREKGQREFPYSITVQVLPYSGVFLRWQGEATE